MEQRAADPRLVGERRESRLVARRLAVRAIDDLFESGPLLARACAAIVARLRSRRHRTAPDRANTIAKKSRIGIRTVDARDDTALREERLDVHARHFEQRTNDTVGADGVNSAQAREPAAGDEQHEDRFRLIDFVVRGGDVRRAGFASNFLQKRVADIARSAFDAVIADPIRIERTIGDAKCHAESRAQLADELLVAVGLRAAKMMVHVCG
jgi:hypothetical protein